MDHIVFLQRSPNCLLVQGTSANSNRSQPSMTTFPSSALTVAIPPSLSPSSNSPSSSAPVIGFLSLSSEIRNKIYINIILVSSPSVKFPLEPELAPNCRIFLPGLSALAYTSTQMYIEFASLWFLKSDILDICTFQQLWYMQNVLDTFKDSYNDGFVTRVSFPSFFSMATSTSRATEILDFCYFANVKELRFTLKAANFMKYVQVLGATSPARSVDWLVEHYDFYRILQLPRIEKIVVLVDGADTDVWVPLQGVGEWVVDKFSGVASVGSVRVNMAFVYELDLSVCTIKIQYI
ncbi:hypothetical protein CC78DRAFT_579747 [Lojkania enalia]|uniref:Uncharacterized protein n=1 Tax=Lojkania enalia TaxID=147567 RepID=A0A9P4N6R8_9PLEO|nr:hypothetical protein CC78DRAFT_579747 [Didymosphaeria enalia]